MNFNLYSDVKAFYTDVYGVLMRHEAQNLIPLGNIIIGNEGRDKTAWRDPSSWFMATVTDKEGVLLTAVMTPPWNLTLYATGNVINDGAIACLINGMAETGDTRPGFPVPGVLCDKDLAGRFSKAYSQAVGIAFHVHKDMRIHELVKVNPEIPMIGSLRLADEKDLSFLPYWVEGFNNDCFGYPLAPKPDPEPYLYQINKRKLYILEDKGAAVSMAMINREMQFVCGVSQVYTPPYFRGKGYASSCVAGISRIILERGFTKCVLYTDLSNPVSNSIYRKIGYVPVCDSSEIKYG